MEPQVIYEAPPLRLTVSPHASPAGVALLAHTIYGTHGPQYVHTGQAAKVRRIPGPYFFDLWHGAELVGTYCLSARTVYTAAGPVPGHYGRYLAVAASCQGRGYGRLLKQQAVRYVEQQHPGPQVFYSYVESGNARSLRISAAEGFQPLARLEALSFGRLYPQADPRVRRLAPAELPALRALLAEAYREHTLVYLDHVGDDGYYFGLHERGRLVAGVQASPTRWRVTAMPGPGGWLLLRVLPHLPVLRRLLNPHDYRFASLEGLYAAPGHEPALLPLLESVLAYFGFTSALLLLDEHDPLAGWLRRSGQLGLLQKLKQPVYSQVLAKLHGLTREQLLGQPPRPAYASAFDYT